MKKLLALSFALMFLCAPSALQHESLTTIGAAEMEVLLQKSPPPEVAPIIVEPTQADIEAATPYVEPSAQVPTRPLRI